ncbi:MAG TPA: ligase-associated DNA damage response exonuclease [Bacteriovoracaceae bacterium]|nr:ligase-associated DNA damage response exonuclease [Bacteriovoracaceae bacterium]
MSFYSSPLISWTEKGLYCEAGGFYIDPHRAVDLAVITHAHSDHARRGHGKYLCVKDGLELLRTRIGKRINVDCFAYGEQFVLGDTTVSLHSAGHILGSAQVRVQRGSEVWVASGDYKRDRDPSCDPFEIVPCDTFITEATFGAKEFVWPKNLEHGRLISDWWEENAADGRNSILFGYSLGKAQRILAELSPYAKKPILIHSTISELTDCYRKQGRLLAETNVLSDVLYYLFDDECLSGELILAPPSIMRADWASKLGEYRTAFASGWMNSGGFGRYDKGFVMSDHADWEDLNLTIRQSGAHRVFVQHRDGELIKHLRKDGIDAHAVEQLKADNYTSLGGTVLRLL